MKVTYLFEGAPFGKISKKQITNIDQDSSTETEISSTKLHNIEKINNSFSYDAIADLLLRFLCAVSDYYHKKIIKYENIQNSPAMTLSFFDMFNTTSEYIQEYLEKRDMSITSLVEVIYGKQLIKSFTSNPIIPVFTCISNSRSKILSTSSICSFIGQNTVISTNGYECIFKNYNFLKSNLDNLFEIFGNVVKGTSFNNIKPKFIFIPLISDFYRAGIDFDNFISYVMNPRFNKGRSMIIEMINTGESILQSGSNNIEIVIPNQENEIYDNLVQNAKDKIICLPKISRIGIRPIVSEDLDDNEIDKLFRNVSNIDNIIDTKDIYFGKNNDINIIFSPGTNECNGNILLVAKLYKKAYQIYSRIKQLCNYISSNELNVLTNFELFDEGKNVSFITKLYSYASTGNPLIISKDDNTNYELKKDFFNAIDYYYKTKNTDKLDEYFGFDYIEYFDKFGFNDIRYIINFFAINDNTIFIEDYNKLLANTNDYAKELMNRLTNINDQIKTNKENSFFGLMKDSTKESLYNFIGNKLHDIFVKCKRYTISNKLNLCSFYKNRAGGFTKILGYDLKLQIDNIEFDEYKQALGFSFSLSTNIFANVKRQCVKKIFKFSVKIPINEI